MQRNVKIGLGAAAAIAVGIFAAIRFGAGPAARTGLDRALSNLPPGWTATHGAVTYDALAGQAQVRDLSVTQNGKLMFSAALLRAEGIAGVSAGAPPARIGTLIVENASAPHLRHIGRLELRGVEIANIRKVFDPASYPNGTAASADLLPLFAGADATDVSLKIDTPQVPGGPPHQPGEVDLHAAQWHSDSLAVQPLSHAPDYTSGQGWQLYADFAARTRYGGYSIADVTETTPDGVVLHMKSARSRGYDRGRIDSGELDGLDADLPAHGQMHGGHLSLAHAALQDADFAASLRAMPDLMRDPKGNFRTYLTGFHVGGYGVSDFRFDAQHGPLISLASFSGGGKRDAAGLSSGSATMRGLKIVTTGRDIAQESRDRLNRFGMADFNIDFDEAGSVDSKTGHLKLTKFDITLHGLGALRCTLDLDGIALPVDNSPQEQMLAARSLALYGASLRWDDASLADRLFRVAAAQSGKTEQELRAQMALPVAGLTLLMPEQPDAAAQLNAFLDGRHHLTITLDPPQKPVTLAQIGAAGQAEKAPLLGIRIKGD